VLNDFLAERILLGWVKAVPNMRLILQSHKFTLAAVAVWLALLVAVGCVSAKKQPAADSALLATNLVLTPGPNDERIAYVAARLMQEFNYSQLPLDGDMSRKIFNEYLDALDPRHENFLQTDVAEFAHYSTNLDKLLIGGHTADLTPAYQIFQRFLERTRQHAAYVEELLKEDRFKFNTDERFELDRRHAPFPANLDEAQTLWQQRLRYEYLQEKLGRELATTNENKIVSLPKTASTNICDMLERHYQWNLRAFTNWGSDNVLQAYLNALTHAYDPHSDYFSMSHAQDFSISMSLSLFGIGAQLSEDDGYCTIRDLIHGGPADKSKLLNPLDRIVAVAQSNQPPVAVVDMELDKVVQQIRGPKGTEVRLTISPAEDHALRRVVSLVRDEIKLEDSEAKAKLIESRNNGVTNRIGIIDLPSFYATVDLPGNSGHTHKSTTEDVTRLIKKLKQEKVSGIILDLRFNPGGSLEEAVKFTGLFIKDGPVVQARSTDGQVVHDDDTDSSVLYDGPLVVLVNRFSASASEIAAAALQDYGRALIVGDTSTFGKGTVQNLNELKPFVLLGTKSASNDPGTIKITIRKFYRVSGASTQWKGVEPDIVLPDTLSYRTDVESERTLDNSLQWDTIDPVKYDKLNLVQPYLAELLRRSNARVATNRDFNYVREDIAEIEKLQTNNTVTLNEREALKERQQNTAKDKAREAERAARSLPDETTYDITVENADAPGLVESPAATNTTVVQSKINPVVVHYSLNSSGTNYFGTNGTAVADRLYQELNRQLNKTNLRATTGTVLVPLGTNTVSTNSIGPAVAEKKSPPPFDPMLDETRSILEDYISILSKSGILMADH